MDLNEKTLKKSIGQEIIPVYTALYQLSLLGSLESGIDVHVRLLIFGKFSHLYGLIPYCTFINFSQSLKNIKITLILSKMFMYSGQKKDRTGDKFSESKFFEALCISDFSSTF